MQNSFDHCFLIYRQTGGTGETCSLLAPKVANLAFLIIHSDQKRVRNHC